ncbi:hypothetical protein [Mycoplasma buteonis]|uniref:hypothetical protein n=1 Tax=Mycoplasma buteonis TaxID=171280 RepID=UPI00055E4013|nr:hypothetical protein [Mycoplasma buteonis]
MASSIDLKSALETQFSLIQGNASSGEQLKLSQAQASQVLSYVFDKSVFINELCNNNTVLSASSTHLTVAKNQASKLAKKSKLGTGEFNKWRITKDISIPWNEPLIASEAITQFESQMMPVNVASAKATKILNQFAHTFERTSFTNLENKIITDNKKITFDYEAKKPEEIYDELVKQATTLSTTVDQEQGIDLIDPDDIVIMVKPLVFDKLAKYGLIGNRAERSYDLGASGIKTLAGYRILSNPYLNQFDAIVSVNFLATGAMSIIALNYGKVDNLSEDLALYFEGKFATGIVYDKLAVGLAKTSVNKKDENKAVELPDGIEPLKG